MQPALSADERQMLVAMLVHERWGFDGVPSPRIPFFRALLMTLRVHGLVTGGPRTRWRLTSAGREAASE